MRLRWAVLTAMIPTLTTFAGRPLTVDDTGTVEPRNFELEAGSGFVHDGPTHHFDFPLTVSYGVVPTLQAGIGFGGQLEERAEAHGQRRTESDVGDLTLGAKWNPLATERCWADHTVAFTVKLPTASRDKGFGSGGTDFD